MSKSLEDVLKELVETAEAAYSPLIVTGLRAALARITELEKKLEAVLAPKVVPPIPAPPPKPAAPPAPPAAKV